MMTAGRDDSTSAGRAVAQIRLALKVLFYHTNFNGVSSSQVADCPFLQLLKQSSARLSIISLAASVRAKSSAFVEDLSLADASLPCLPY